MTVEIQLAGLLHSIDKVRSAVYRQTTGGIGFFEVIENREAAFILFDTGKELARIKWYGSDGRSC